MKKYLLIAALAFTGCATTPNSSFQRDMEHTVVIDRGYGLRYIIDFKASACFAGFNRGVIRLDAPTCARIIIAYGIPVPQVRQTATPAPKAEEFDL